MSPNAFGTATVRLRFERRAKQPAHKILGANTVFESVWSLFVASAGPQTARPRDAAPAPSSPGAPLPDHTTEQQPTMHIRLSAGGGAYGLVLSEDPIRIDACITTTPPTLFPLLTRDREMNPNDLETNLDITIRDERMNPVQPMFPHGVFPAPLTVFSPGQCWSGYGISNWGYSVSEPGRYYVGFDFQKISAKWAAAHGFRVSSDISSEVTVVKKYSDADRHFIDPPKGWIAGQPPCLGVFTDRTTNLPALALNKMGPRGDECFYVYTYPGTIRDGIDKERKIASSVGSILLSEDDDAECGWDHVTTLTYRRTFAPYTHTEAVLLNLPTGYIVARYERPDTARDDSAAEDALDAPCRLL